jgi:hypothetical protein
MSNAETVYSFRSPYPEVLERGRQQVIQMPAYRDGALVAPSSGTVSIYDASNSAIVDAAAVTIAGSIAQYTVLASVLPETLNLGEGYMVEWALDMPDSTTRTIRRDAAVVLRSLYPVITDTDVEAEYPDLAVHLGVSIASWQTFIDEAWNYIIHRLINSGQLPYLIMSPTSFRFPHKHLALHYIWKWFYRRTSGDTRAEELFKFHWDRFNQAWAEMTFKVDYDHDGRADDSDRSAAKQVVHRNVAPYSRYSWRNRW